MSEGFAFARWLSGTYPWLSTRSGVNDAYLPWAIRCARDEWAALQRIAHAGDIRAAKAFAVLRDQLSSFTDAYG